MVGGEGRKTKRSEKQTGGQRREMEKKKKKSSLTSLPEQETEKNKPELHHC